MKIAHFDCFSGISGDMVLGALVDLGLSEADLTADFEKLKLGGYTVRVERESRGAIMGSRVSIIPGHEHSHRTFRDIRHMIESSGLDRRVREKSIEIFERLAQAEGRVHGVPPERVHFHEVGAVDSILDIVGAASGLHRLGIERVSASALPLGGGYVETQHGKLPVPAPATVLLLAGMPVYDNGIRRELVTPTGAAILGALADSFGTPPPMTLLSVGYGVGSHPASDPPNLLRVLIGTAGTAMIEKRLLMIETNIDDMNPEIYNYVMDVLFAAGALDVGLIPMQMKKNRPGVLIRVLADPGLRDRVIEILMTETSSLGARVQEVERFELLRELVEVETSYGPCRVKRARLPGGRWRITPEYEDCRRIATENRVPLMKVYEVVLTAAGQAYGAAG